ncbi:MAG: sulfotransferase [Halieaceae bacterium]|nr:sulfotransferase [Halieaceae bacterium]
MERLAIFGVPRSGTSWLSLIFNSHPDIALRFQPLFSFEHKGRLNKTSSQKDIYNFFEEIYSSRDDFALMASEAQKNYPIFSKSTNQTHIIFKETRYLQVVENILAQCPNVKIFGIVRNPLSCLASWIMAPKEFNPEWNIMDEWRIAPSKNQNKPEEFYGFNKWKQVAENFLRFEEMYPNQFKLVRYDQLNEAPLNITNELFKFCGLSLHSQVDEFIKASQSKHDADPYSVFRAKRNDNQWQNILPADVIKQVQKELVNSTLQTFLIDANNA